MHGGVSGGGGGGRDHIKDPLEVGECDFNEFSTMFSTFFLNWVLGGPSMCKKMST